MIAPVAAGRRWAQRRFGMMVSRSLAMTSRACLLCLARRQATTRATRIGIMLQGTRTPKSALSNRKSRIPLQAGSGVNPMYLQQLRPAPGAYIKHKRAGRSHASKMNRGGTKGRPSKTSRTYVGGGTPVLSKMIPKRVIIEKEPGLEMANLHVDRLAYFVRQGRIDPTKPITLKELAESGCCKPEEGGIRLYGTLSPSAMDPHRTFPKIKIVITKASPKAIRTVEKSGGIIVARYHSKLGTRAASRPDRFIHQGRDVPRLADPVSKRDLEYYSDPANRGYIWLKMQGTQSSAHPKTANDRSTLLPTQQQAGPLGTPPGPEGLENPPSRRAEEA